MYECMCHLRSLVCARISPQITFAYALFWSPVPIFWSPITMKG